MWTILPLVLFPPIFFVNNINLILPISNKALQGPFTISHARDISPYVTTTFMIVWLAPMVIGALVAQRFANGTNPSQGHPGGGEQ